MGGSDGCAPSLGRHTPPIAALVPYLF
jgi:hypothetical protein